MRKLILFTEYFPFSNGPESAFVQNEIIHHCNNFDKVVVVPSNISGKQTFFNNFEVNTDLALALKKTKIEILFYAIFSSYLFKELFSHKITFWDIKKIKRLIHYTGRANIAKTWINKANGIINLNDENLLYTFWNNEITLGVSNCRFAKTVSRAHGYDIYEEYRGYYGYLPCYKENLASISKLFLVSRPAVSYLEKKFPQFSNKYEMRHLGVKKAETVCRSSTDDIIRIVSCSFLIERKRVELIAKGIISFIDKFGLSVQWTHFGDGEEKNKIITYLKKANNSKLDYVFKGYVENNEIIKFYNSKPVDIFITVTELEGGVPVSIQEAQAHGIPAIGTSVGGLPEIINSEVGVLLDNNPSEDKIASAINYIISDRKRHEQMRFNSLENWRQNYDEAKNYSDFSQSLVDLLKPYKV